LAFARSAAATRRRKSSSAFSFGNAGRRDRRRLKAVRQRKTAADFRSAAATLPRSSLTAKAVAVAKEQGVKFSPGAKAGPSGRRLQPGAGSTTRHLTDSCRAHVTPKDEGLKLGVAVGRPQAQQIEADEKKITFGVQAAVIGETRSPSPREKRWVRKFIVKTSPIASATLAMIPAARS
jgi:hypothetical protein